MNKVEPKTLPGFMELLPGDQILFNEMYDKIRKVYEKFGFLPLDTPTIEYSEVLLAKAGGETEKQIYRFNKGDNDLSLRFDLTVPLARYVAEHYNDLAFPFKRYQMSKVFRGERPQKGRFREFYQCDIDVIGNESLSIIYDAEMPAIIYELFKELDFGPFVIRINNRKILNGFFRSLDLTDEASDILRIIDKIDKIGADEVKEILIDMNIDSKKVDKILDFISIKGSNDEILSSLKDLDIKDEVYNEGLDEIEKVINYIKDFGMEEDYYRIDLTIARGLDYYTGTVYETNLVNYPNLGSVCSGGRYDNLTGYYTSQNLPGIGISIGLTRLFSQLLSEQIITSTRKSMLDALIVPFDSANIKYSLKVATMLRDTGKIVDVYYDDKGMKQKMKYANRLGVPYVIVIGSDEIEKESVTLKNMESGEQELVPLDSITSKI
jgi:histidyl-tRNA synthetase